MGSIWTSAAAEGHIAKFETLSAVELESVVATTDEDGRSLLHLAVAGGHFKLLELLVTTSSAPSVVVNADEEGWTPLHSAVSIGSVRCVEILLQILDPKGINAKNKGGRTALHYGASKGHTEIVSMLIEKGANLNAKDKFGSTPLHRAASTGQLGVVQILVQTGKVDLSAEDGEGQTPLLVAVKCGNDTVAILLASHGADLEAVDKEGSTPLGYARPALRETLTAAAAGGNVNET